MPVMTMEPAGTSFRSEGPFRSGEKRERACWSISVRPSSEGAAAEGAAAATDAGWTATTGRASSAARPWPAAQRPQRAWLNVWISPGFGWFVPSDTAPGRSPRTSSTKPLSAFFGPTSTKVRTPSFQRVSSPPTHWTGEATCLWSVSLISATATG